MEDYTAALRKQPAEWLRALSTCLGGQWIERDDTVGFFIDEKSRNPSTTVEFNRLTGKVSVSVCGLQTVQWSAALDQVRLTQEIDDSQLLTELAASNGDELQATQSLAVWGPRATYCGGVLKLREVPDCEYVLSRIIDVERTV